MPSCFSAKKIRECLTVIVSPAVFSRNSNRAFSSICCRHSVLVFFLCAQDDDSAASVLSAGFSRSLLHSVTAKRKKIQRLKGTLRAPRKRGSRSHYQLRRNTQRPAAELTSRPRLPKHRLAEVTEQGSVTKSANPFLLRISTSRSRQLCSIRAALS